MWPGKQQLFKIFKEFMNCTPMEYRRKYGRIIIKMGRNSILLYTNHSIIIIVDNIINYKRYNKTFILAKSLYGSFYTE